MIRKIIIVSFIIFSLIACTNKNNEKKDAKLSIIATIFPISDIAQHIGGNKVVSIALIKSGQSPHTYEPTPQTIKQITKSDIFIKVGFGLDLWLNKISTSPSVKTLDLSQFIKNPIGLTKEGTANPHYWLSVRNGKIIAQQIFFTLKKIDPDNGSYYETNYKNYVKKLDDLDKYITNKIEHFSIKKFVAFHPAWVYFARDYGLEQIGVIEKSPGKEITPKELNNIIKQIKKYNIKAIFAEPQFNPNSANVIANETGGKVLFLDPLGGKNFPNKNSYIKLIKYNVSEMEKGMR